MSTKTITVPNVDLSILNLQHEDLMDLIWDDPDSLLWGLVEMLDYIIDNNPIDNYEQLLLDFN